MSHQREHRSSEPPSARTGAATSKVGATSRVQARGGPIAGPPGRVGATTLTAQQSSGGDGAGAGADVHRIAARGVSGGGGPLPHRDAIQRLFGRHDVSGVRAHVGGEAQVASQAIGAEAYATGSDVAFAGPPDLHTAAHEAAHVVQQRAGVQLKGGLGEAGDVYERHADAVADAVVQGQSAEALLDQHAPGPASSGSVQRSAVQLWRATKIDNATKPSQNDELRSFIDDNDLKKDDAEDGATALADYSDFNTLHHIINRDLIAKKLAPALKFGVNHANVPKRTAATAFLDKVKVVVDFHEDILTGSGDQQKKLTTLLNNMPLNFELGYGPRVNNPKEEEFDPRVVKTGSAGGIDTFAMDALSTVLNDMNTIIQGIDDERNVSAATWNRLTELLTRANTEYEAADKLGDYLMKPDLEQWDAHGGEAQRKGPGRYVSDVATAFGAAGNRYATTNNKEPVGAIDESYDHDVVGDIQPADNAIKFTKVTYKVPLRHIAARHTMKFFQFEGAAINSFFPGIATAQALKLKVNAIIADAIHPVITGKLEDAEDASFDYSVVKPPTKLGNYYVDSESAELDDGNDNAGVMEHVATVALKTVAPDGGDAIYITLPKINEFIASKNG